MGMAGGAKVNRTERLAALAREADDQRQRELIKSVFQEIITETMAQFGRWSLRSIMTATVGWACYVWIQLHLSAGGK